MGGSLVFRGDGVCDALRRFRDVVARSPRDLSCQAVFAVDESFTPVLMFLPCSTGGDAEPEEPAGNQLRSRPRRGLRAGTLGAVGFRRAAFNVSAMAVWEDPALDEQHIEWARDTAAAVAPWSFSGGGYVNYMQADEPIERARAAFGDEALRRLQALKTRYDPHNVLRQNQNVPPA